MNTIFLRGLAFALTLTVNPFAFGESPMNPIQSNEAAIAAEETFNGSWPFKANYLSVDGQNLHYIDEGEGELLLFLHGEPTWSYLFRHQIAFLSKHYRVVAIDHAGFGKSSVAGDRSFYLQDHIRHLSGFVEAMKLKDITLVMHDFGGPVGMGLLAHKPQNIKRVISLNGPTPFGQEELFQRLTANGGKSPWFQWIISANEKGTLRPILEQSHYSILSTLKLNGFVDNSIISDTWIKAYQSPFPTKMYTGGIIGWAEGFAQGKHEFAQPTTETISKVTDMPAMAIWGSEDKTLHAEEFIPLFQQAFPRGLVHLLEAAGHYSPEDQPEQISHLIHNFIQSSS